VFEAVLKRFQRVSAGGVRTTTSANSLKTLQNGHKHRETTKNTTGKQGKSVLFTEH